MITGFRMKWRMYQTEKYKKMMEQLINEHLLEKRDGVFLYEHRANGYVVTVKALETSFACTLRVEDQVMMSFEMEKNHPLFDKVMQEQTMWETLENDETIAPLRGLSKQQQVKYKKLVASSVL